MSTLISVLSQALEHDLLNHTKRELLYSKSLPLDATIRDTQCHALFNSFSKKFEDDGTVEADELAIQKFVANNDRLKGMAFDRCEMPPLIRAVVDHMREDLNGFFMQTAIDCCITASSILDNLDVGPGASALASGTSPYHKLGVGTMSTTSLGLYQLYVGWAKGSSTWNDAEYTRRSIAGLPVVVQGSKISTVPKNRNVSRTICTEPLLNMMFQKGIGTIIERRLKTCFGITYSGDSEYLQPDKNGELARRGSIDGSYSTIDLSMASDSVTPALIRLLLPKEVVSWLIATRCSQSSLPDGSLVDLHMLSTMGNGYTFPLQTTIFASVVRAVYKVLRLPIRPPYQESLGNYGTYGDDIICLTKAAETVLEVLTYLGFIPNSDKTFTDVNGRFRESCGYDYQDGVNVRGVYCKSLKKLQDKFTLINRLNDWSEKTGIALTSTVTCLLRVVGSKIVVVPLWENDDAGVRAPLEIALLYGVKRVVNHDTNGHGFLYSCYKVNAVKLTWAWGSTFLGSDFEDHQSNPSAGLLCGLRGNLRDGTMTLRSSDTRYQKRFAFTPGWGSAELAPGESQAGKVRKGSLTWINLMG